MVSAPQKAIDLQKLNDDMSKRGKVDEKVGNNHN